MTRTGGALTPGNSRDPDDRARAVETQLTDDERFALIVSVVG